MISQPTVRPPRLTRAERRAQTREQLVAAAMRVFARKGYAGASVDDVAGEAGFTVGALYSNFAGKQELFMAAFERHCEADLAQVQALLAADLPFERQLDAITHRFGDLDEEHRQWWLLSMELWLYAQRDPAVRERLAALRRKVHQTVADALERQAARSGRPLEVPAGELAAAMLGLWQGLMLQRLTDPESTPPGSVGTALAWLQRGATHPAVSRSVRDQEGGRP
jgi:AcrR family transcriptional regulator